MTMSVFCADAGDGETIILFDSASGFTYSLSLSTDTMMEGGRTPHGIRFPDEGTANHVESDGKYRVPPLFVAVMRA